MYIAQREHAQESVMTQPESQRWARQGLQLPPNIAKEFKELAATQAAFGGVQVMGTAAIALFLGMPKDLRDSVCDYVVRNAWKELDGVTASQAWRAMTETMVAEIEAASKMERKPGEPSIAHPDDPKWYLDRILDPDITPPPGSKSSQKPPVVPPVRTGDIKPAKKTQPG